MVESTLRRISTVSDPAEFEGRREALVARLLPHLQRQPGFVSHELRRDGDRGGDIDGQRDTRRETGDASQPRAIEEEGGGGREVTHARILDSRS